MSVPTDFPPQLARFPAEVQDAYRRFRASGEVDAIHRVVEAALLDFLPKASTESPPHPLGKDARLMEDLGYDSLAIAELVFFLEDLFKVTISTEEIRNVSTVDDLRTFVIRKLAGDRPSA